MKFTVKTNLLKRECAYLVGNKFEHVWWRVNPTNILITTSPKPNTHPKPSTNPKLAAAPLRIAQTRIPLLSLTGEPFAFGTIVPKAINVFSAPTTTFEVEDGVTTITSGSKHDKLATTTYDPAKQIATTFDPNTGWTIPDSSFQPPSVPAINSPSVQLPASVLEALNLLLPLCGKRRDLKNYDLSRVVLRLLNGTLTLQAMNPRQLVDAVFQCHADSKVTTSMSRDLIKQLRRITPFSSEAVSMSATDSGILFSYQHRSFLMHTPHVSIPLPSDSIFKSTQYYFTADVPELRSALAFLLTSPTHVLFHATTDGLILQVSVNTCTNFDLYSIGTVQSEVRASISTPITFELTPYAACKLAYFLRLAGNFASFSAAKPNYILCASKHYRTVLECSYNAQYEPLEV